MGKIISFEEERAKRRGGIHKRTRVTKQGTLIRGTHRDGLRSTLMLLETMAYDPQLRTQPEVIEELGEIYLAIEQVLAK